MLFIKIECWLWNATSGEYCIRGLRSNGGMITPTISTRHLHPGASHLNCFLFQELTCQFSPCLCCMHSLTCSLYRTWPGSFGRDSRVGAVFKTLIALSSYLHLPYREGRASGIFLSQENPVLCSVGLTNTASESPCWLTIARLVSKLYLGMANLTCDLKGTHLILYNTRPPGRCSAPAMAMPSLQVTKPFQPQRHAFSIIEPAFPF